MTGEVSKDFHGVGIGPLSKILAVNNLNKIEYLTITSDLYFCSIRFQSEFILESQHSNCKFHAFNYRPTTQSIGN